MTKFLITGGAGFVGSHLADRLIGDGHTVWVIDDLSTGAMQNIDQLVESPNFDFCIGSITDEQMMAPLIDRVDVVFHLAAAVGVQLIINKPTQTIETNVRGAEVVLSAAAKKGKLVVIASTSEVYGKSNSLPYSETDDLLLGPTTKSRWGYACSKAIDEYLALAYVAEKKLPVIIVRLFNTVGPRQVGRYGMVVPTFVGQGLSGEDITVFGTGEQQRCFSDVGEVVDCLVRLANCPTAIGQVFNIGSNIEISINALAELVRDRTGQQSKIVHIPYGDAYAPGFEDLQRRVPDTSKLQNAIGCRPCMPIESIVDRIAQHMRNGE